MKTSITQMFSQMFGKIQLSELNKEHSDGHKLQRALGPMSLIVAGIAAIIGGGIFVLSGKVALAAGPGGIYTFAIGGVMLAIVAMCMAELANMTPRSGSTYNYIKASLGEFTGWLTGWDMQLEYGFAVAVLCAVWSGYFQAILQSVGIALPAWMAEAPASLPWYDLACSVGLVGLALFLARPLWSPNLTRGKDNFDGGLINLFRVIASIVAMFFAWPHLLALLAQIHSVNLLAVVVGLFFTWWLTRGIRQTAWMNSSLVFIKVAVILLFIAVGAMYIKMDHFNVMMPNGWAGVFAGLSGVVFAYIGFDCVATHAEETVNPQRALPIGILGSLAVCSAIYMAVVFVLVGAVPYNTIDIKAPIASALLSVGANWAVPLLSLGALAGISSALVVSLYSQSRVMLTMSRDGLLPKTFARVDAKTATPTVATIFWGVIASLLGGFVPVDELVDLVAIGTLMAFMLCCVGVIILRKTDPDHPRGFKCPLNPILPALGAISCALVIWYSVPTLAKERYVIWMLVSVLIYFSYGYWNSIHRKQKNMSTNTSDTALDASKPDNKS